MTEREIFLAVLDLPGAAARSEYLDRVCDGDSARRARIEALLVAHDTAGSFLGTPAAALPNSDRTETMAYVPGASDQDEESDCLQFLTPSKRPDSLGRIGHYEVLQVLGKGGFGIVFRAFDDVLQRVVAVKVMAPQLAATSPARKRFLREARTSAQVRHENVVQVYEVAEQPLPFLVMEFIPGETLQQRLDRTGPLDAVEVVRIGRQIAEGLAAAHATELIHRDIKPGNVLIESGQHRVKITDFGLARAADDASISQSGIIAGTPMYMAPEQALGQTLDQRADLFSLGSVLYQMAAGRPPFRANNTVAVLKRVAEDTPRSIREIIPETPKWLCSIISKLHAKNPDERFQSARDVADVLADCESQLKTHSELKNFARIPEGEPAPPSPIERWKWVATAVACVLLIPIGILLFTQMVGDSNTMQVVKPVAPAPDADGWVQLFNGKDLTGWKTQPKAPGRWEVNDGILSGRQLRSVLFSERGDYANFHLRVVVKVNLGGDSGLIFRTGFGIQGEKESFQAAPDGGYEAEIHKNLAYPRKTGTVTAVQASAPPLILGFVADDSLTQADEWFTLEVIAEQNRFITKINGKETANCSDPLNNHSTGHIALQLWNPNTLVQFRKIEIKELPASPPSDGFVQLFNGKDLTEFKGDKTVWSVKDGDLIATLKGELAKSATLPLVLPRQTSDFELRFKARLKNGLGGCLLGFRSRNDEKSPKGIWLFLKEKEWGNLISDFRRIPSLATDPKADRQVRGVDFNDYSLRCEGNKITLAINGDTIWNAIECPEMPAEGVFAFLPLVQQATEFELGGDDVEITFRDLRIRKIPSKLGPEVKTPPTAAVQALRDVFTAKQGIRDQVKLRMEAGQSSVLDLVYAEIDLVEARIQLTHAAADTAANIAAYRSLVTFREKEHDLIEVRVKEGVSTKDDLLRADSSLATAKGRLAKALAEEPDVASFTDADAQRIAALPAVAQIEEVRKELKRLNPKFDGTLSSRIEKDIVTELKFLVDEVDNIAPLRALKGLTTLECSGTYPNRWKGKLADLSPLKGMTLTWFKIAFCPEVRDLSPLQGMLLTCLDVTGTRVTNIEVVKEMPITSLSVDRSPIADLSPLAGKSLKHLHFGGSQVKSLSDVPAAKVEWLMCYPDQIPNEAELNRLGVTDLHLWGVPDTIDPKRLRAFGARLKRIMGKSVDEFLKEIEAKAAPAPAVHDTWIKANALLPLDQYAAALTVKLKERLPGFEDAMRRTIPSMAADRQAIMVVAWLRDRNPAFEGEITYKVEGGVLTSLEVSSPLVQDLTPLRSLSELKSFTGRGTLGYDNQAARDAAVLRPLKALETINGKPAAQFWKDAEAKHAEFQEYLQLVPTLTAQQQVAAVVVKLKERNPGFDDGVGRKIEDGVVTELSLKGNNVTDLSPVRALEGLKVLNCTNGPLSDLSPLQGMQLTSLNLMDNFQVSDLSPLKGMPLINLDLNSCRQVRDLEPLKGMQLTKLNLRGTKMPNLESLAGMPLTWLMLAYCSQIEDLSPLKGMPLTNLDLYKCQVKDLEPLKRMPLTFLNLHDCTPVKDLTPLKELPLTHLSLTACAEIRDLEPIMGLPMKSLSILLTGVTDLSPLKGVALEQIHLTPRNITQGMNVLRDIKSLKTIAISYTQAWPAAEFWERYDKGEFK